MPKHLYLLRHAQSAEKQIGQPDKERELTGAGTKGALLVGSHLYKQNIEPDLIISSTAIRALATARFVADALKMDYEKIFLEEEIYSASARTFLQVLQNIEDHHQTVLCVGHNPVITYISEYLTRAEIGEMVPAGLACIKFNFNFWKEINQGNGELLNYIYPEMLVND